MKAVLISIRPEWCDLIARGEKTLEVRKTRPKIDTPFKCYIYRTKGKVKHILNGKWFNMPVGGSVIGEFICDTYVIDRTFGHDALFNGAACMTEVECAAYSTCSPIYGWHISNLKIYEKPKKLRDFTGIKTMRDGFELRVLERPPQSWCYVMEVNCNG
ncbi:MAG: hypothetical protein PUK18_02595 [Firmicutes bacterium]|nr:hypothetical protein [Bacillota bacterium]MDY6159329.1 hypothetical protein [Candidatus Faecousia sp.]